MLNTVIEKFAFSKGISNYALKPCIWDYSKFTDGLSISKNSYAFFYKFVITGLINVTSDIAKKLVILECADQTIDFSKIVRIEDFGTIQQAVSDYIFWADNIITLDIASAGNNIFTEIYKAHFEYFLLTPISELEIKSIKQNYTAESTINNIIIAH